MLFTPPLDFLAALQQGPDGPIKDFWNDTAPANARYVIPQSSGGNPFLLN
jgi:hypothetical protein